MSGPEAMLWCCDVVQQCIWCFQRPPMTSRIAKDSFIHDAWERLSQRRPRGWVEWLSQAHQPPNQPPLIASHPWGDDGDVKCNSPFWVHCVPPNAVSRLIAVAVCGRLGRDVRSPAEQQTKSPGRGQSSRGLTSDCIWENRRWRCRNRRRGRRIVAGFSEIFNAF